ncbi:GNAT family N-acetyltransferase [Shimwellia pseudoproteus]|uniref:GNAT family N-acetyltransferase n=1 Tax=Shimwellia pseudoproteus TaxID=570012 RepID=UPI0018EB93DD|nr:GNAT family N-acetyltransferase [Shimwellia pseudoproteus]MBJ3813715.1 GNAT family N-acetyltransferase [Shimwellia pseudoproteus]
MQISAPQLETPRLLLRAFRLSDFEALAATWQDPEMVRHIGNGEPQSREMSWGRLLRYVGHWQLLGYGYWACIEKASGTFIGSIGIQQAQRLCTPALTLPEAGWSLRPFAQGKGYAREGLSAVLAWADQALASDICCIIGPDNQPSIRLALAQGFQPGGSVRYHDNAVALYIRRQQSPGL